MSTFKTLMIITGSMAIAAIGTVAFIHYKQKKSGDKEAPSDPAAVTDPNVARIIKFASKTYQEGPGTGSTGLATQSHYTGTSRLSKDMGLSSFCCI